MSVELLDPADQALLRLSASRTALRAQLIPTPDPSDARTRRGRAGIGRRLGAAWRLWRGRFQDSPLGLVLMDQAQSWWQRSPWRVAGEAVADEASVHLLPWVRRHPVASISLASFAGAALVASRRAWMEPWVMPQARALPGRLGRWTLRQLSTPSPLSSLLLGLLVVGTAPAAPESEPASASAPTPTPKGGPDV